MILPLTDAEIAKLRWYAETEETTGLLDAALNELLMLRASLARMEAAGENLLAAIETAQTERGAT